MVLFFLFGGSFFAPPGEKRTSKGRNRSIPWTYRSAPTHARHRWFAATQRSYPHSLRRAKIHPAEILTPPIRLEVHKVQLPVGDRAIRLVIAPPDRIPWQRAIADKALR